MTRKWIEVNDLSGGQYHVKKNTWLKPTMLRPDLCDYSDVYIVVKGIIAVEGTNDANKSKNLVFNDNAPVRSCISKINNTLIKNS